MSTMGWCFGAAPCWGCGRVFPFHPDLVPSIPINLETGKVDPVNGKRQPVCHSCMLEVNEKRKKMGLDPHPIHPQAYDIANEGEVKWNR
ncbi:MAG: hypothetical protein ACWGQW_04015 [bacterium]